MFRSVAGISTTAIVTIARPDAHSPCHSSGHSHPGMRVPTRMGPWHSYRRRGTRTGGVALVTVAWHSHGRELASADGFEAGRDALVPRSTRDPVAIVAEKVSRRGPRRAAHRGQLWPAHAPDPSAHHTQYTPSGARPDPRTCDASPAAGHRVPTTCRPRP